MNEITNQVSMPAQGFDLGQLLPDQNATQSTPAEAGHRASRDACVMIVDDEKPIREVLGASLIDEGYTVDYAENGFEGLEKINSFQPQVVLLDIWMPGDLDGIGVLKKARDQFPQPDFLMMSGHGTIETAVQATKLGAWDFIEKPLSFDRISILIKNILSFQRVRNEKKNLLH